MQRRRPPRAKSQSAMEYLMTYGWSILIIAVVLGALFQLGVFNSANFAPKAPTGNCKILRVAGTYSLEGTCTGVLPQSVASFSQSPAGYIAAANSQGLSNQITVSFWFYPVNNGYWGYNCGAPGSGCYWETAVNIAGSHFYIESGLNPPTESWKISNAGEFPGVGIKPNTWQFFTGTFDGSTLNAYINGQVVGTPVAANGNSLTPATPLQISGTVAVTSNYGNNPLSGLVSNVQVYNTSLDSNQIRALYLKGIGAAPIDPAHTVGWWPLNGDTNDYSGGNNNGAATAMTYTGAWTNGYVPP